MMESSDTWIFGIKDGVCVAAGWKQTGTGAEKYNAKMIYDWVKKGRDIRMMDRSDPEAKMLFDQMWDNAQATKEKPSPARAGEGLIAVARIP